MPQRPARPCSSRGCPALTHERFCPEHQAEHDRLFDGDRGNSNDRGYGAVWRRLRAAQLLREPLCKHCEDEGLVAPATEVDHVIPKAQGGVDEETNLQSLCKPHHSAKTAREVFHGGEATRRREKGGG